MSIFKKINCIPKTCLKAALCIHLLAGVQLHAQSLHEAKKIIDTICSPYFAGRGYIDSGHVKAALYIKNQFETMGLQPLPGETGMLLPVRFSVNTFPESPRFFIGGSEGILGKDFLPGASSGPARGRRKAVLITSSGLLNYEQNEIQKLILRHFLVFESPEAQRNFEEQAGDFLKKNLSNYHIATPVKTLTGTVATWQTPGSRWLIHQDFVPQNINGQKVKYRLAPRYEPDLLSYNVAACIPGTRYPDSAVVITAHYDHLGKVGHLMFPGAHDNASGVALLLQLARHFSQPGHRPECTVIFIAFTGEEAGLIGSHRYVSEHKEDLSRIRFLLNLDIVGACGDGLMVVNGLSFLPQYEQLRKINAAGGYFDNIKARGRAANSDHFHFSEQGVPSFFIYGLQESYTCYHHPCDNAQNLPLSGFENLMLLSRDFLSSFIFAP